MPRCSGQARVELVTSGLSAAVIAGLLAACGQRADAEHAGHSSGPATAHATPAAADQARAEDADASSRCSVDGDCVIGSLECGPCGSCWGPGTAYNRAWLNAEQARCSAERKRMKKEWDEHPVNCEPCPPPEEEAGSAWPKHARCEQGSCTPIPPG